MVRTQRARTAAVTVPLGEDTLLLQRAVGREEMSRLFSFELDLLSENPSIPLTAVVGNRISLRIDQVLDRSRVWNGVVASVTRCGFDGDLCRYRAVMVPWLWCLTHRTDCRIFQGVSVPEIVAEVFARYEGLADADWSAVSRVYPKLEYCVQYRESDFAFVSRLLEREGISYYFRHSGNRHTMVLTDSTHGHAAEEGAEVLPYRQREQRGLSVEHVRNWETRREVQPSEVGFLDFDFTVPTKQLLAGAKVVREDCLPGLEHFDYSRGYTDLERGRWLAKDRLEHFGCLEETHRAETNCRLLACGSSFRLSGHPDAGMDREYLVTKTAVEFGNDHFGSVREGAGFDSPKEFACRFEAIELVRPFRPARTTPVPTVGGSQTAIVTGRPGDELCIDRHARVKVQFHWDRYGASNERSSCWVRVSQPWAGKNYGGLAVPRVGQEVIVDFLEGDPDRPIVTGRVYNGANMPPISAGGRDMRTAKQRASQANKLRGALRNREERMRFAAEAGRIAFQPGHGPVDDAEVAQRMGTTTGVVRMSGASAEAVPVSRVMVAGAAADAGAGAGFGGANRMLVMPSGGVGGGAGDVEVEPILPRSVMQSAMMTSIRSSSLGHTGGSNEITMNDTSGNESMFMKAQHDEMHIVGNDREDFVTNNEVLEVGVDRSRTVGNNETVAVGNDQNVDVGNNIKITAGSSIVLECGASRLSMNSAGVITLTGTMITVAGAANVNVAAPLTNVAGAAMLNLAGMVTMVQGMVTRVGGSQSLTLAGDKIASVAAGDNIVQGKAVKLN